MLASSLVEVGLVAISVSYLLRQVLKGNIVSITSSIFMLVVVSLVIDTICQGVRVPLREGFSHRVREGLADEVEEVVKYAPRSIARGSLASHTTNYLEAWVRFLDTATIQVVHFVSAFIIAIGILAIHMPALAAVSLVIIAIFGVVTTIMSRKLRSMNEEVTNAKALELRYLDAIAANDIDWLMDKLTPLRKAATLAVSRTSKFYYRIFTVRSVAYKGSIYLLQVVALGAVFAQLSHKALSIPTGYLLLTTITTFCSYLWLITVTVSNMADISGLASPMAKLMAHPRKQRKACPPWLSASPITIKQIVVGYRNDKFHITALFCFEEIELIEQFNLLEGGNGSGKSTLMRALSHGDCETGRVEVKSQDGTINLLGYNTKGYIVAVPQNLEKISVPNAKLFDLPYTEEDEFVDLPMMLARLDKSAGTRLVAALRAACLIGDPEHDTEEETKLFTHCQIDFLQEAGTLSGGQKRRIYLAAGLYEMLNCLHNGAELVLGVLDEPSSEVDQRIVPLLRKRLRKFGENNPSIRFLFTAHDQDTKRLADDVIWLQGPDYERHSAAT
jgi:ABC-type bacteriocin/lantibiotic exporter with double-glycine peptidase domain